MSNAFVTSWVVVSAQRHSHSLSVIICPQIFPLDYFRPNFYWSGETLDLSGPSKNLVLKSFITFNILELLYCILHNV